LSASLFLVDALPDGDTVVLDGPEGHHAADVQRVRPGESLLVSDGRGALASGLVTSAGKGRVEVRISDRWYREPPSPRLVVAQAIAKGERGELAVQAMTEIGVDEIVPWAASRSVAQWRDERGDRARQRWCDTAREASKQARRPFVPSVSPALSTRALALRLSGGLVLHESATEALSTVSLPASGDLVLVVGPEGGIAPEELAAFESAGARTVRLGDTVLRTSTAGMAALAVLSVRLGRW
jgi:16S rRNA (uracil1498-N3)-methyltransferase